MPKTFALLVFILLTACDKPAPVFEKISQDATIMAFGDSLTYGTGASNGADYPSILSQISTRRVINEGIPGEVSKNGLSRLPNLLDQHKPELLILVHGGNDLLRKIPEQQTANNLKQMVNEARQRDIKVVMLGVPKPKLFLMNSAEIYQQIAEQLNIPIDLETLPEILSSNHLKSDMIHPNDEGYRMMAENILKLLVTSGAL